MENRPVTDITSRATHQDVLWGENGPQSSGDFEHLIQRLGDQYMAHLRSLTVEVERHYSARVTMRETQMADLTRQLTTLREENAALSSWLDVKDEEIADLGRQLEEKNGEIADLSKRLAASEEERATFRTRLQAAEASAMRNAADLRELGEELRRRAEANIQAHADVFKTELG